MTRWALVLVMATLLAGCGQPVIGSPSGQGAPTARSDPGEPVVLAPGTHTLEPGVTYLAPDFDPPFMVTPSVTWEAAAHSGDRGRNVGELTLRLDDVAVHLEQPGVSDAQGGQRVPAPETLEEFIAALESVPGIQLSVGEPFALGEATAVRIDATLGGAEEPGGWPAAIFGVDEVCIGRGIVTRFYLLELTDRLFLALPPCQPTATNEDWSAAIEALLATLEEPGLR